MRTTMRRYFRLARLGGGVRLRLTLWYLAVIAVLFFIFSGVVAGTLTQEAYTQEEAVLSTAANQIGATYSASACTVSVDDPWQDGTLPAKPGGVKSGSRIVNGAGLGLDGIAVLYDAGGHVCRSAVDGAVQAYGPLTAGGLDDLTR